MHSLKQATLLLAADTLMLESSNCSCKPLSMPCTVHVLDENARETYRNPALAQHTTCYSCWCISLIGSFSEKASGL
uniref:Secreted protein n=1 Tax=Arundo donax TaxID=35708 RepID=A0A0A8Y7H5_ARUDO